MAGLIGAPAVYAEKSCGGASTILIECDTTTGKEAVNEILGIAVRIFMVIVGVVGVIGIVIAGIQYLTARDNEEQVRKAKRRLFHIVIGLAVYVLMFAGLWFFLPGFNPNFGGGSSSNSSDDSNNSSPDVTQPVHPSTSSDFTREPSELID